MKGKNVLFIVLTLVLGIGIGMMIQGSRPWTRGSSPADRGANDREDDDHSEHDEVIVSLRDEELKEFGIEVATAGPGELQSHTI